MNNNLNVIKISESSSITEALGIDEQRRTQLIRAIMLAEFDTNTVTGAAELMSKECRHANELFFIALMFGQKLTVMSDMEKKMSI